MQENNIIRSARRLDSVQEYYFSSKLREIAGMRSKGINVLNLGIGSPDLPPSQEVVSALNENSQNGNMHAYQSYAGIPELREAFAKWYADFFAVTLDPEKEILPMIGSKEGIMHIAMTFLEPGDIALIPNPGYPTYKAASELAGAETIEYKLSEQKRWLPDLKELVNIDLEKVKILWMNYPNMPTGAKATKEVFEQLAEWAREHRILLVNDNPYSFILNNEHLSLLSIAGAKAVALELNSLSKSHNMAGWRVGMLAGDAGLLRQVLRFKSNMDSGMFKPVQLAAAQALQAGQEWFDELNQTYLRRKELVCEICSLLGCTWSADSVGLFVWAKVPDSWRDGYQLSERLLEKAHVFITPGGVFGTKGNNYIRASLCNDENILNEALKRIKSQKAELLSKPMNGNSPKKNTIETLNLQSSALSR